MRGASRSPVVLLSLGLALGALSLPSCQEKKKAGTQQEIAPAAASANLSLKDLEAQVGKVQQSMAAARARFKALPEDLPGLDPVRSKLHSIEEVQGVEEARVRWLAGELTKAVASGSKEQMQKVSETITGAIEGSKGVGNVVIDLVHQLLPFERVAPQFRALAASGPIFTDVLATGYEIKGASDGLEKQLIGFLDDPKKKVDKKTWFVFDRLAFLGDEAQLDPQRSNFQLENVAEILKAHPQAKVEIGGYTDNTGPAADSKKVSAARAETVKDQFVAQGIPAARLTAAGYGPAHPVCAANDTDECRAKNRRIAVRVTAK